MGQLIQPPAALLNNTTSPGRLCSSRQGAGEEPRGAEQCGGGFLPFSRSHPPCFSTFHRAPVKNGEEENSVVEAYLQCGADTVADRALLDMVEQVGFQHHFGKM